MSRGRRGRGLGGTSGSRIVAGRSRRGALPFWGGWGGRGLVGPCVLGVVAGRIRGGVCSFGGRGGGGWGAGAVRRGGCRWRRGSPGVCGSTTWGGCCTTRGRACARRR